jgi:pimeloyl-ACP methyl ester carboxylesterase
VKSLLLPEWQAFLRYEDLSGESPAQVYLAGLILASHASFTSLVAGHPELARRRSLFVDLLGSGFSDAPDGFSYSLEEHANTIAKLLDRNELQACNLIGYSFGGAVAIMLAAKRPDLVSQLVLMEANLDPGEGMVSTHIAEQSEEEFYTSGFNALIDSFRQAGIEGDETSATIAGLIRVTSPQALYRGAVELVRGTRPTLRERLFRLKIPRVYIFGEHSLPNSNCDALVGQGVRVLSVPNAGHGMAWDNPSAVAEALVKALTGRK